jgi:GxxExxY protein
MEKIELLERETTHAIIGAFFEVYSTLGFGFLEHVYARAMERELVDRGKRVSRETSVPVFYKGRLLTRQRTDVIVEERVVVEIKSTEVLPPMAKRQVVNYLKATSLEVALLLHFGPEPKFYRMVQSRK